MSTNNETPDYLAGAEGLDRHSARVAVETYNRLIGAGADVAEVTQFMGYAVERIAEFVPAVGDETVLGYMTSWFAMLQVTKPGMAERRNIGHPQADTVGLFPKTVELLVERGVGRDTAVQLVAGHAEIIMASYHSTGDADITATFYTSGHFVRTELVASELS